MKYIVKNRETGDHSPDGGYRRRVNKRENIQETDHAKSSTTNKEQGRREARVVFNLQPGSRVDG